MLRVKRLRGIHREMVFELHKKLAIPLTCLLFPSSLYPWNSAHRSVRSRGFAIGVACRSDFLLLRLAVRRLSKQDGFHRSSAPGAQRDFRRRRITPFSKGRKIIMKILVRYLTFEVLKKPLLDSACFLSLFLIIDFFEKIRMF